MPIAPGTARTLVSKKCLPSVVARQMYVDVMEYIKAAHIEYATAEIALELVQGELEDWRLSQKLSFEID